MSKLRIKATENEYQLVKKSKGFRTSFTYTTANNILVKDFVNWMIVVNDYPYDAVASTHHLLVPKRAISLMSEVSEAEAAEYEQIMHQLETDGRYDSMQINFSKEKSVLAHLHVHLLVWLD